MSTYSYYESIALSSLSRDEYNDIKGAGMLFVLYPEACGIYEDDVQSRIDAIGQNGNDGLHYRVSGSDSTEAWPHFAEDSYMDKINKIYEPEKDNMFVDDYIPSDPISPSHYQIGNTGVEAIDIIQATLSKSEFIGYLRGNILKYQLRASKKNGTEDLNKADVYSGWLVAELEEDE